MKERKNKGEQGRRQGERRISGVVWMRELPDFGGVLRHLVYTMVFVLVYQGP